jgi:signal transduction histidine kinase/ActR/RegA family two-component response regulator
VTRRLSLSGAALGVLIGMAALTALATVVVHTDVASQQRTMLRQRSSDYAEVLSNRLSEVQSALAVLTQIDTSPPGSPQIFDTASRSQLTGSVHYVGVAQRTSTGYVVTAGVGPGLAVGSVLTGARGALASRAASSPDFVSTVIHDGAVVHLDFALSTDSGQRVVFRESTITPAKPQSALRGHPFNGLNVALYAAATPQPANLILTSTTKLPLRHNIDTQPVVVGNDTWLMVSTSRGSLLDWFTRAAPWLTLAGGLALAALLASFVETLARRRTYALDLVQTRTAELQATLAEHARLESEARRAGADATAANRSKSAFLSRMSHELRTPLNAVLGFAQLLEIEQLRPNQVEAVEQITKGGRHLLDLINEVLDISRIETGNLTLSPEAVLAKDVLEESLDLMRPLANEQNIHLVGDTMLTCNVHVFADRQRLKQVLLNLIANAIKYNRIGGTVAVSCETKTDRLRLRVTDTGAGIAPEHRAMLFEPFERLGAEHGNIEGTGIGLALSRRLAEAMGGTLGVDTTLGSGSTFWVDLPIVEDPVERLVRADVGVPIHIESRNPGDWTRKILYIEDNLSNLRLIEQLLTRRENVELVAAMQGRLGIDLARQHRPSVVLLDLHLPDINGEEILAELRADPSTASIPVVILSADATPGRVQRLLTAGAHAYLTKPLDVRQLLATLDDLLDHGIARPNNG